MVVEELIVETTTLTEQLNTTQGYPIIESLTVSELFSLSPLGSVKEYSTICEEVKIYQILPTAIQPPTVFKVLINNVEIPVFGLRIVRRLSDISSAQIKVYKNDIQNIGLGSNCSISWYNPELTTYETLFIGEVSKITISEPDNYYTVELDGIEIKLKNSVFAVIDTDTNTVNGVFEYNNVRADQIANDILLNTDFTLIECPTDQITLKFDYISRWKALGLIADILNKDLWVDTSLGVHIGEKSQTISPLSHIYRKIRTSDIRDRVNRVIIIGGADSKNDLPIGVAQDGGAITTYGEHTKVKKIPQIRDTQTAIKLANAYLDRFNRENRELDLTLPLRSGYPTLKEGDKITDNNIEFKINRVVITEKDVSVTATPSIAVPNLTSYIQDAVDSTENNNISSDFESSTPISFALYENIELIPDQDGDGIVETINVNGTDYTIIGVMHFYIPDNFDAQSIEMYMRQYSVNISDFGVVVNGVLLSITETIADDNKKRYNLVIPVDIVNIGWNNVYFIDTNTGGI